jgi:hypothetical protein
VFGTTLPQLLIDTCLAGHKNESMRRFFKFLVLSAACICVSRLAWAQEMPPGKVAIASPWMGAPRGPQYAQLFGTCSLELAPTKAVIVGGVAAAALKPTDAAAQLDKQLDLIRKYVEEQHGQLKLLERARTVKNPPPNAPDAHDPPFQEVQRLEAAFAADAPLDAILDRLIELGLDRFGENVLNTNNSRREPVVRFRVTDWEAKMRKFQDQCTADAWKKWCDTDAAKDVCHSDVPPPDLQLQFFNVHSVESVLYPDGGVRPWNFSFSPRQPILEPPDLLGVVSLHLNGSVNLNYSYTREEKP